MATKWWKANLSWVRAYHTKWRKANPSRVRANRRRFYKKHGKALRIRNRAYNKAYLRKYYRCYRDEIVALLGKRCECCRERRREFLAIDHRHGGGTRHRQTVKSGLPLFRYIRQLGQQARKHFRVLCHNCNTALGVYGYCPHHRR